MKVNNMESMVLGVPLDYPFKLGAMSAEKAYPLIVKLFTDDGLESFGVMFTFNPSQLKSMKACIDDLETVVIGMDINRTEANWQKLYYAIRFMGRQGYGMAALSAIDTALWGLKAKALGMPLSHLLGGFRDSMPVYASFSLWRDWSIDRLQKDGAWLVEQGFKTVKMKMGDKPLKVEIERLEALREAVGEKTAIMIDANWAWTTPQAILAGRKLEENNVYWLEDPLASDDPAQLSEVAAALDMTIAIGETYCSKYDFRNLIEKKSGDAYIIDLQRVGGVTEWMKVAAMAQAWNIPVANHLFSDISIHLVAAVPNAIYLEYMPWWHKIYRDAPEVKDGLMQVPQKPGLGFDIDPDAVKKYKV